MRNTVTADIEVDVPIDVAYNQWTQFESFPSFLSGVESVTQLDDTLTHWKVKIGGVEREFDARIVDQVPDDHISWQSVGGEVHAGTVHFRPHDDQHTEVELRMEWEPDGFVEKVGSALQLDDLQVKRDLKKFKELIEASGYETGGWRGEIH